MEQEPRFTREGVDVEALEQYQDSTGLKLRARWLAYKELIEKPLDYYDTAYRLMGVSDNSVLLDVGCSDGYGLNKAAKDHNHFGPLIGVDIATESWIHETHTLKRPSEVLFVQASAEFLPFDDNSIDFAFSLFTIYHAPDPEKALLELKRVVKPGGRIAISTSGNFNKPRHRQFEREVSESISNNTGKEFKPSPIFTKRFNNEIALKLLTKHFELQHTQEQVTSMEVHNESEYQIYELSMWSYLDSMKPRPQITEWREAMNLIVRKQIEKEIASNGVFEDPVERYLFIVENRK